MAADAAGDLLALGAGTAAVVSTRGIVGTGRGCGQMRDVFGDGMAGADVGDADVGGFTGFAEGVVTGIEVLAFLDRG